MFPRIAYFVSSTIVFTILAVSSLIFFQNIINLSIEHILTSGLTAFGILAIISGLCFSMGNNISNEKDKEDTNFAGEKLFHSSLLLIQTIFLKYIIDKVTKLDAIQGMGWLINLISIISNILIIFVGLLSTSFLIYGFEAILNILWRRYQARWLEYNKTSNKKFLNPFRKKHKN